MMTGPEVAELLQLKPLPDEGGQWAQTWLDDAGSSIYFLMQDNDFSALHRLKSPELWHHYGGAPVQMLLLDPNTKSHAVFILGDDLLADQRPFYGVKPEVWMGARTMGEWSLVGTTMAPPYHSDGFEMGSASELAEEFPYAATLIPSFTRDEDANNG